MKFLLVVSLVALHNQLATSQILRPPPYLINRQTVEKIIDAGNFINHQVINEPPCNNLVPISNIASPPSTTVITDCSPAICQNLANTIQLMIVCNLLQNSQSSDAGRLLAAPILNELMSMPGLSNPLFPNIISPGLISSPNIVSPNFGPNVITNYIPPNAVGPNFFTPNFVAPTPNVISPNFPLPPRIIAPSNPCPNAPQVGSADVNRLINTLMGLLGNIRG